MLNSKLTASPKVSIILPVYNNEAYIKDTIHSVIAQTYKNWELIIVDDGSSDGSAEICDSFADKDNRIRVFHKTNGGVSSSRNMGLEKSTGDYITWLDSDDQFCETALESLLTAIQEKQTAIAFCNYSYFDPIDGTSRKRFSSGNDQIIPGELAVKMILGGKMPATVWSVISERSLWDDLHFNEGTLFEDIQLTYKLFAKASSISYVSEPLLFITERQDSLSRIKNLKNRVEGMQHYINRYCDVVQRLPECHRSALVIIAKLLILLQDNILANSPAVYREYSGDIRAICRFLRKYRRDIIPPTARKLLSLEFCLMTAGSRTGFVLAKKLTMLANKGHSTLGSLKVTDLPEL